MHVRLGCAALLVLGCRGIEPTEIFVHVESDMRWMAGSEQEIDEVEIDVLRLLLAEDGGQTIDASASDAQLTAMDAAGDAQLDASLDAQVTTIDAGPTSPVALGRCVPISGPPIAVGSRRYVERHRCRVLLPSQGSLPLTLGIIPENEPATIRIEAIARRRAMDVVHARAELPYTPHHIVHVFLYLTKDCAGVPCDVNETCRNGACVPIDYCVLGVGVDAGSQICIADAGTRPMPDAAVALPDAGRDAGPTCASTCGNSACECNEASTCPDDCVTCARCSGGGSQLRPRRGTPCTSSTCPSSCCPEEERTCSGGCWGDWEFTGGCTPC